MAIRVYPYLSPRIIEVLSPDNEITIQDLHNEVRDWEDSDFGISFEYLIDSAGKEDLGGGVSVGITSTLNNAYVMFTGRTTPLETGTCTTGDSEGTTLHATGGQFQTNNVAIGDTVMNYTTKALANVIDVVSDTELQTLVLSGGSRATWLSSDEYIIWNNEQCNVQGGNLVAVDDVGANISPILPSPNTQIVRTSSSSATLADLSAIQYASYQNAIWLDPNSSVTGTAYPIGTREEPVNNITDAVAIAEARGFSTLQVLSSMALDSGTDIEGYTIIGQSHVTTVITMHASANCTDVTITNCTITGTLDGGTSIYDCVVGDLTYVNGHIHNSGIEGTLYLAGSDDALLANCFQSGSVFPVIDMGAAGQNLSVIRWSGQITVKNSVSPGNVMALDMASGQLTIDSTVVAGGIIASGIGAVVNNGTPTFLDTSGLMSKATISEAVGDEIGEEIQFAAFNNAVHLDALNGSAGTTYPLGTSSDPVDNLADAKIIAAARGFETISVSGDFTLGATDVVDDFILVGDGATTNAAKTTITMISGCSTSNTEFKFSRIEGVQGGESVYKECVIGTVTNMHCQLINCAMVGPVQATNSAWTVNHLTSLNNCYTTDDFYTLDYNDSPIQQVYSNFSGKIRITNFTHASAELILQLDAGEIEIDSSCTAGNIIVRGIGELTDNSAGATVNNSGLMSKATISDAVLNTELAGFTTDFTVASSLRLGAYNGVVTVDTVNGAAGTSYPTGTLSQPVNTLEDAVTIASSLGIEVIHFISDYTFGNTVVVQNYVFIGEGAQETIFTFVAGCIVVNCRVKDAECTGNLTGVTGFEDCLINDLGSIGLAPSSQNIIVKNCLIAGTTTIPSNYSGTLKVLDCWSDVAGTAPPILDMGSSTADVIIRRYAGGIQLNNVTEAVDISVELDAGQVIIDSTCTDGYITVRGVGKYTDNSTGTTVDVAGLISKETIAIAVWDENVDDHITAASSGKVLRNLAFNGAVWIDSIDGTSGTAYPLGTPDNPVDNFTDALSIANTLGFKTLNLRGTMTISSIFEEFSVVGLGNITDNIVINTGFSVEGSSFERIIHTGVSSGSASYDYCLLSDLSGAEGVASNSGMSGTITLGGAGAVLQGKDIGAVSVPTIIDMVGANRIFSVEGTGQWLFKNMNTGAPSPSVMQLSGTAGVANFDSSCTGGIVTLQGGYVIGTNDSSGLTLVDSTLDGRHGTGNWEGSGAAADIANAVWDETLADHLTAGTTGKKLYDGGTGDPAEIAAAVWDADKADYNDADTMGELQNTGGTGGGDPAAIADAVWDEASGEHDDDDTMGQLQNKIDNLVAAKPKIVPGG